MGLLDFYQYETHSCVRVVTASSDLLCSDLSYYLTILRRNNDTVLTIHVYIMQI